MSETSKINETAQLGLADVVCSVFETYTTEQLIEEGRILNAEIEAAIQRLSNVENEIFYRNHPECKRY